MDRNEHPLEPCHLGVPSGASNTISEHMVWLAQTMKLSCVDTNTISKRIEMRFHMTHVNLVFYLVCPKWFLSLWYVRRKPCSYLASRLALSPNRPKRAHTLPCHQGVPSGVSKTILEPMARLAQTMQLSYVKVSIISKQTKTSIHLSFVT
jgi:hypothetical protein